ncbi:hypothetical protein HN858_02825 [Candidatus Falkowbacteria bacterium]|jgi:hypothetical protein|nr:hypothetical protein [Candidatus Falkowbacteria bacterium]MBT5503417.1 hypothetical protein [Candidatus Falkowbacteria bacterium]MBT6574020.1 hypothetical protein [Candidatus Falkowbacteria bacterium]MBT7348590.1 hypothetical protein [Candidatus Falkowbacteria bacterium]MBT7500380.1 hypothetical protein [Candidatus Falkowbacteria bacterium]
MNFLRQNPFTLKVVTFLLVICFSFVLCGGIALAADGPLGELGNVGKGLHGADKPKADLPTIVGSIIKIILTLLGIIMVILVVWGGVQWMTAGGNEDQVKKAKQMLTNAVIGLAITLAAYAIAYFAVDYLVTATTT